MPTCNISFSRLRKETHSYRNKKAVSLDYETAFSVIISFLIKLLFLLRYPVEVLLHL